ncbi:glycosyltransferase [Pseudomonas viridiflava]|uniref:glycosyltransferase n=1 Tax=Pseudomonas viridiflava TaxID=33069 RepID=UPI001F0776AD|nr:glycosyltransferase [Pseudomonas viridiflava]
MERLKVLYVITSLGVGGAERQVMDIARHMTLSHEVCICFLTGDQALSADGLSIRVVGLGMRKGVRGFINGYSKLRSLVCEFKPDVVHSHMVHANILSRLLRLAVRFPVLVCSAHNTYEGGWLRMLAYRLTNGLADLTTNVSHEAVEAFEVKGAVRKGEMRVVPNGIDTDLFRPDPEARIQIRQANSIADSDTVILAVGRLVEAKDYPTLLRAYAQLKNDGATARLWVVGEGSEQHSLEKLTNMLGLHDDVLFMGVRHDVASLYNAADIYVLSSAWEGFGLVVAEAMATERVVVATDCGGIKEVVGSNGFLVQPGSPILLAQVIHKALELSDADKADLGARARARIKERFSLSSTVLMWQGIYATLLGRRL